MNFFKTFSILTSVAIMSIVGSCIQKRIVQDNLVTQQTTIRPREAWVLRSVLDLKPRMLSAALNDKLWVAYNTQTASLYKAWKGDINFDGPVYTSAHGPQPTTRGISYMEEPTGNLWIITEKGVETTPVVIYKGHSVLNNQLLLKYELEYKGKRIKISEKPDFLASEGDNAGFERVFAIANVPQGVQVSVKMHLSSITAETDYKTDGTFTVINSSSETVGDKQFKKIEGKLVLNNDRRTSFSVILSPKPVIVEKPKQEDKSAEVEAFAIMAKSDCNTCHNKDLKTIGPSYFDIAKRYSNNNKNKNSLITKVLEGGAGNWGEIPMTPHPTLSKADANKMISYILLLDASTEKDEEANKLMPKPNYEITWHTINPSNAADKKEKSGMAVNIYKFSETVKDFPELTGEMLPVFSGTVNALHATNNEIPDFKENFVLQATGNINVKKTTNIVFRLVSDDGSRFFIDDQLVVDNGGNHPLESKDGEIILKAGKHPFKVEYFQGGGGSGISLQWAPHGSEEFEVVPPGMFTYQQSDIKKTQEGPAVIVSKNTAGDGSPLVAVHPSFDLTQARPDTFKPKAGGIDFFPDGRMVVTTWDSLGSVYLIDGRNTSNPNDIKVKRIAYGLAEPLGVKIVDNEIYVLQKQELTKLVDLNMDDIIDEYQTISNGWKVSANFHEFAFGLVYKAGYFYGTLATAINPGGASTKPQISDRGKVVKISKKDGSTTLVTSGLRTPNGINIGVDNEIFIADNQGDWLPSSKIVHFKEGAWYGSRSVDFEGTANLKEMQPVVWLPQDEIGNSPSQPAKLNVGPYINQMIHGDVTHGGIKRVFAEKVNGDYQGVVFRFTQGLEAGVNRLAWAPDGSLYIGGVGSTGNWGHSGKLSYGLQKLTFNNKIAFEMLAVRAKPNGVEIEFTEPLKEGSGEQSSGYNVRQWYYKPTGEYGGPKLDEKSLEIKAVKVSPDRKKVLLELTGMLPKHLVYIRLNKNRILSSTGKDLWTTEAWYTMNNIPSLK